MGRRSGRQEVETAQFFDFFQVELGRQSDYKGVYRPKSRAKTMSEEDARAVDGCAIFYRQSKSVPRARHLCVCLCVVC
jgi:CCR4-NOT transcription complex subunit 6